MKHNSNNKMTTNKIKNKNNKIQIKIFRKTIKNMLKKYLK